MSEHFDAADIALAVEENEGAMRQAPTYEVSEKQAELDFMQNTRYVTDGQKWAKHTILSLRQQLAAAQAENLRLRMVLERLARLGNGDEYGNSIGNRIAQDALATTPGDMAALREVIAQVLEDAAKFQHAAALRSGEWTPEALK